MYDVEINELNKNKSQKHLNAKVNQKLSMVHFFCFSDQFSSICVECFHLKLTFLWLINTKQPKWNVVTTINSSSLCSIQCLLRNNSINSPGFAWWEIVWLIDLLDFIGLVWLMWLIGVMFMGVNHGGGGGGGGGVEGIYPPYLRWISESLCSWHSRSENLLGPFQRCVDRLTSEGGFLVLVLVRIQTHSSLATSEMLLPTRPHSV